MARSALLNVMVGAVRKASRGLRRDFGEIEYLQVSRKGVSDFVTIADRRVENILQEELEAARPGYCFLMEETGDVIGSDKTHRWIIDPIDGTTNFMHGVPLCAISVALEREGKLVAAVIYNPISEELFVAEKGKGAFLEDRRLRVSGRKELSSSLVCCGIPHLGRGDHGKFLKELAVIQGSVAGIRRTGSAALDLAWVAAGRFDGFWERSLKSWDIAAGILMVQEAGGTILDIESNKPPLETGNIVSGNEYISHGIRDVIRKV